MTITSRWQNLRKPRHLKLSENSLATNHRRIPDSACAFWSAPAHLPVSVSLFLNMDCSTQRTRKARRKRSVKKNCLSNVATQTLDWHIRGNWTDDGSGLSHTLDISSHGWWSSIAHVGRAGHSRLLPSPLHPPRPLRFKTSIGLEAWAIFMIPSTSQLMQVRLCIPTALRWSSRGSWYNPSVAKRSALVDVLLDRLSKYRSSRSFSCGPALILSVSRPFGSVSLPARWMIVLRIVSTL